MRKWLLVAISALVLTVAISGCASPLTQEEEPTPTPIPTPIIPEKPVYEVKRGEIIDSEEFLCRVAPVVEQELFFKLNGRISVVNVEKGDQVQEGDILAELEVQDLTNQIEQARVDLEKAQLALDQELASREDKLADAKRYLEEMQIRLAKAEQDQQYAVAEAQMNLENAIIRLEQARNKDPQLALQEAEGAYQKAKLALQEAQIAYTEAAQDPSKATAAAQAYEAAKIDFQLAEARYESAKASAENAAYDIALLENAVESARLQLEKAQAGVDPLLVRSVEAAQREVERLESGSDSVLEKNVEQAQLRLDRLLAELDNARIVAPFAGTISSVLAFEGREAQAYKAVIIIAQPEDLELSCDVASSILQRLAEGMQADIVFSDSPGQKLTGVVRRLPYPYGGGGVQKAGVEEQDKSTRIAIEDDAGRNLEVGDLAKVSVVLEAKQDVLYLPSQAIRSFEGRKFIVIQNEDGSQQRVDVKTGIQSKDGFVEIVDGAEEGQIVVGP